MLHQGIPLDINVSDDKRSISVVEDIRVDDFGERKTGTIKILDARLMEDESLEVLKSTGSLLNADAYYIKNPELKGEGVTSVLSTFYERQEFDPEGIEVVRSSYSKTGYPLVGVSYDNEDRLTMELTSEAHKPSFDGINVILPPISNNAIVESVGRMGDNPALAMYMRYQRGPSDDPQDSTVPAYSIAVIESEWPETLRINGTTAFADKKDGEWKVRKDSIYSSSEGVEECIKNISLEYEYRLERSLSKRHELPEYYVIKERMDETNKQYKIEEQGRSLVKRQ
jgi:hypothetical protein